MFYILSFSVFPYFLSSYVVLYSNASSFTPFPCVPFHTIPCLLFSFRFYPLPFLSTSSSLLLISSFFGSSTSHFPLLSRTCDEMSITELYKLTMQWHTHVCIELASNPREIWRHEGRRPDTQNCELRTSMAEKGAGRWTSGKTHNFTCFSSWWWTVTSRPISDMTPNFERKCNPLGTSPVFYGSQVRYTNPISTFQDNGTESTKVSYTYESLEQTRLMSQYFRHALLENEGIQIPYYSTFLSQ